MFDVAVLIRKSWPFALVGALGLSCLPIDDRPPPASVLLRMSGTPTIASGIPSDALADGWSITFDKFLVSLGNASLNLDSCTAYTEADYRRIFDGRTLEPQKVSLLFALGTCGLNFRVTNPDSDSIVSKGVTDDDKTMMRTSGQDRFTGTSGSGVSIYVKGSAKKGAVTKTFAWSFRKRVGYADCTNGLDRTPIRYDLQGNASLTIDLSIHGEVLFQDHLDPTKAKLRFGPFADADDHGNGDGEVTLDELDARTLADAGVTAEDLTVDDAGVTTWTTFADYVYLGLFPQVVRLGDKGTCSAQLRSSGRG